MQSAPDMYDSRRLHRQDPMMGIIVHAKNNNDRLNASCHGALLRATPHQLLLADLTSTKPREGTSGSGSTERTPGGSSPILALQSKSLTSSPQQ